MPQLRSWAASQKTYIVLIRYFPDPRASGRSENCRAAVGPSTALPHQKHRLSCLLQRQEAGTQSTFSSIEKSSPNASPPSPCRISPCMAQPSEAAVRMMRITLRPSASKCGSTTKVLLPLLRAARYSSTSTPTSSSLKQATRLPRSGPPAPRGRSPRQPPRPSTQHASRYVQPGCPRSCFRRVRGND